MGHAFAGTPVVAPNGGRVTEVFDGSGGEGHGLVIEHPDGRRSHLLHFASEPLVRVGDVVEQGQPVGAVGSTGVSSGAHLDWRIQDASGEWIDPQTLIGGVGPLPVREIGPTPTDALVPGAISAASEPQEATVLDNNAATGGGLLGQSQPMGLLGGEMNLPMLLAGMQMLSNSGPSTEPNNLFAGVPNALLAGHHLTRGQEQEPFVVNGQVIDPRTMEVLGDFRDQPEGGLFSGSGVNAEALNAMVESGRMTPEQAQNWALGRVVTTPDGQMTFITPRDIGYAGGVPGGAPAPVGDVTSSPLVPSTPGVPIGGTRPPDGSERNAGGFYSRALTALDEMNQLNVGGVSMADHLAGGVPLVGNYLVSPEYQAFRNAGEAFVAAVLRQESGAAITEAEMDRSFQLYFPQPGDSPETIAQKERLREQAVRTLYDGAGRAQAGLLPPDQFFAPPAVEAPSEGLLPATPEGPSTGYPDWSQMDTATLARWMQENQDTIRAMLQNDPDAFSALEARIDELERGP